MSSSRKRKTVLLTHPRQHLREKWLLQEPGDAVRIKRFKWLRCLSRKAAYGYLPGISYSATTVRLKRRKSPKTIDACEDIPVSTSAFSDLATQQADITRMAGKKRGSTLVLKRNHRGVLSVKHSPIAGCFPTAAPTLNSNSDQPGSTPKPGQLCLGAKRCAVVLGKSSGGHLFVKRIFSTSRLAKPAQVLGDGERGRKGRRSELISKQKEEGLTSCRRPLPAPTEPYNPLADGIDVLQHLPRMIVTMKECTVCKAYCLQKVGTNFICVYL